MPKNHAHKNTHTQTPFSPVIFRWILAGRKGAQGATTYTSGNRASTASTRMPPHSRTPTNRTATTRQARTAQPLHEVRESRRDIAKPNRPKCIATQGASNKQATSPLSDRIRTGKPANKVDTPTLGFRNGPEAYSQKRASMPGNPLAKQRQRPMIPGECQEPTTTEPDSTELRRLRLGSSRKMPVLCHSIGYTHPWC